jgi:hypothetical protein
MPLAFSKPQAGQRIDRLRGAVGTVDLRATAIQATGCVDRLPSIVEVFPRPDRRTHRGRAMPLCRVEGVLSPEKRFKIRKIVVSPRRMLLLRCVDSTQMYDAA